MSWRPGHAWTEPAVTGPTQPGPEHVKYVAQRWWKQLVIDYDEAQAQTTGETGNETLYELISRGRRRRSYSKQIHLLYRYLGIALLASRVREQQDLLAWRLFGVANTRTQRLIPLLFGAHVGANFEAIRAPMTVVDHTPGWQISKPFASFAPREQWPSNNPDLIMAIMKHVQSLMGVREWPSSKAAPNQNTSRSQDGREPVEMSSSTLPPRSQISAHGQQWLAYNPSPPVSTLPASSKSHQREKATVGGHESRPRLIPAAAASKDSKGFTSSPCDEGCNLPSAEAKARHLVSPPCSRGSQPPPPTAPPVDWPLAAQKISSRQGVIPVDVVDRYLQSLNRDSSVDLRRTVCANQVKGKNRSKGAKSKAEYMVLPVLYNAGRTQEDGGILGGVWCLHILIQAVQDHGDDNDNIQLPILLVLGDKSRLAKLEVTGEYMAIRRLIFFSAPKAQRAYLTDVHNHAFMEEAGASRPRCLATPPNAADHHVSGLLLIYYAAQFFKDPKQFLAERNLGAAATPSWVRQPPPFNEPKLRRELVTFLLVDAGGVVVCSTRQLRHAKRKAKTPPSSPSGRSPASKKAKSDTSATTGWQSLSKEAPSNAGDEEATSCVDLYFLPDGLKMSGPLACDAGPNRLSSMQHRHLPDPLERHDYVWEVQKPELCILGEDLV